MEKVTKYQIYLKRLDDELSKYPLIVKLEQKCNVPKAYLALGSGTLIFLMVFLNFWGQLLSNLVSWGYPGMY